jgi:hypothetical protein
LFLSRLHTTPHLSTWQYVRIVQRWVFEIGLDPAGPPRMAHIRCVEPDVIHPRPKNLRAVQLLLGNTKLESTVRYLGIEVDDALEMTEQSEV